MTNSERNAWVDILAYMQVNREIPQRFYIVPGALLQHQPVSRSPGLCTVVQDLHSHQDISYTTYISMNARIRKGVNKMRTRRDYWCYRGYVGEPYEVNPRIRFVKDVLRGEYGN